MKSSCTLALGVAMVAVAATNAQAQTYFSGSLTANSPTWTRALATGTGTSTAGCAYSVQMFYVLTTGNYTFETSSFTLPGTSTNLDTFEYIYHTSFNPTSQLVNFVAGNDDFTGTLTVLPGPYTGVGLTSAATGAGGVQPSSRILNVALTAGVQYFAIESSFYAANSTTGRGVGPYWAGIGGAGTVRLGAVPEPMSLTALALGAGALLRRRRKA
jgi:hypothetical protein